MRNRRKVIAQAAAAAIAVTLLVSAVPSAGLNPLQVSAEAAEVQESETDPAEEVSCNEPEQQEVVFAEEPEQQESVSVEDPVQQEVFLTEEPVLLISEDGDPEDPGQEDPVPAVIPYITEKTAEAIQMYPGDSVALTLSDPDDLLSAEVEWSVSDTAILELTQPTAAEEPTDHSADPADEEGSDGEGEDPEGEGTDTSEIPTVTVTAKAPGTATVTVRGTYFNGTEDEEFEDSVDITVNDFPQAPVITEKNTSVLLFLNGTKKLSLTMPKGVSCKTTAWSVSKADILSVSSSGKVKALKAGSAKVTVTGTYGNDAFTRAFTDTITIYTADKPAAPAIAEAAVSTTVKRFKGKTMKLTVQDPAVPSYLAKNSSLVRQYQEKIKSLYYPLSWKSDDTSIAKISSKGKITTVEAGTTKIRLLSADGKTRSKVTFKTVNLPILKQNGKSYRLLKGYEERNTKQLGLNYVTNIVSKRWKSSNTNVAKVDKNGLVKAVGYGKATITVSGKAKDSVGTYAFSEKATITVSAPSFSKKKLAYDINTGGDLPSFTVKNVLPAAKFSVASSDSKNLPLKYTRSGSTLKVEATSADKTGSYKVTVKIDGKTYTVSVKVVKLGFVRNEMSTGDAHSSTVTDTTVITLKPSETTVLKLDGVPKNATVTWKSSNKNAVTVSKNGKIKAKAVGYATITATVAVNGKKFKETYPVAVGTKKGIAALRKMEAWYPLKYSQPLRMYESGGYADCSSMVWRAYKTAGIVFGDSYYAPVAAQEARWCMNNGYVMQYGTLPGADVDLSKIQGGKLPGGEVDLKKILPGDVIFWCGYYNGRYMGIYHVEIYEGNEHAITVANMHEYTSDPYVLGKILLVARPTGTAVSLQGTAGVGQAKLSWGSAYGADGYTLLRSTSKYGTYEKVKNVKGTSYTDKDLKKGKTYYYRVKPYWKSSGTYYGNISEIVTVKTKK